MPLPRQEVDATTPKYLRDKYAIVGVGETTYTRGSGISTRALGTLPHRGRGGTRRASVGWVRGSLFLRRPTDRPSSRRR